ncbi:hypothetical protein PVK06_028698 [Gossypium arboreum]|uniref:Zinc knuckle CX2CX4HX4C domain-containing protein n=1 Tax=Gossypium arboreum TaxID=29729 RepID=A0ABR0P4K0_GOSAR|nr:hypothetical protein PVK06_028698 [Gossypium arboreum]
MFIPFVWIQSGENPLLVPLNLADFWVQIHDLPPGLMTVSMAEQFGNFLGQFLDYDTSFSLRGFHTYMHIKARLEVSKPLKQKKKKKILIGTDRVIYARFQYEKLSLFCFICGKLGHGESFCLFRTSIEPSKIVFRWDITLRAVARRRSVSANKWLRDADGSDWNELNKERNFRGNNSDDDKAFEHNWGRESSEDYPNPNLVPLGYGSRMLILRVAMGRIC